MRKLNKLTTINSFGKGTEGLEVLRNKNVVIEYVEKEYFL